jgi:putative DNA primase/helicase
MSTDNTEAPGMERDAATDALEIARLAGLPRMDYDREREAAAARLGIRLSTLDDAVKTAQPPTEAATGRGIKLREVTPWHMPVQLGELLDDIAKAIGRHVILPPGAATTLALWSAHTWVYQRFDHTPRLAIRSPTKRCGKSTLLEVVEALAHRPMQSGSISASGAFRIVEALAPVTLLLDETDTFLADKEELRGVLNSGFHRSGYVVRVTEIDGEHQPVQFATFAPVAFAGIGQLADTLEDRSVPIVLQRKGAGEAVDRMRAPGARAHLAELAAKLARWSADQGPVLGSDPPMPPELNDREQDISVPLFAIADQAGGAWPKKGRDALAALFGRRNVEAGTMEGGAMLLADIRDALTEIGAMQMPSAELAERLGKLEERPWPEWRHGKPMTAPQLARALAPFGVKPINIRRSEGIVKGYRREHFEEAWTRYLPAKEGVSP